jgi:hypothetical protein
MREKVMELGRYANVLDVPRVRVTATLKAERNGLLDTIRHVESGRQDPYQGNNDHLPPVSPSIGLNVALYAIFGLSRIQ